MKTFVVPTLSLVFTTLAIAACQNNNVTNSTAKIVGGSTVTTDNPADWSTVFFSFGNSSGFCSGTVVAENLVVTAAHCLTGLGGKPDSIRFDNIAHSLPVTRPISDYLAHEDFYEATGANFDIGWIKFSGGLPPGFKPVPILPSTISLKANQNIILAGYGMSETSADAAAPVKRSVTTSYTTTLDSYFYRGIVLAGPTPGKGACNGDSGGPSYVEQDGIWYLLGATHGSGSEYGWAYSPRINDTSCAAGAYAAASVPRFADWISRSSGVSLGGPPPPVVDEKWSLTSTASHKTFHEWCQDTEVTRNTWRTIEVIMASLGETDCARAEKGWSSLTSAGQAYWDAVDNNIDLRPLLSLGGLNRLQVEQNANVASFTDLSAQISDLQIYSTSMPSLTILVNFSSLTSLKINRSVDPIPVASQDPVDLTFTSSMSKLQTLELDFMKFSDLTPLSALPVLKSLSLVFVKAPTFAPIASMLSLQSLDLASSGVQNADLFSFAMMTGLSHLGLSFNQISDVTPLTSLKVDDLDLSGNQIKDPSPLAVNGSLKKLNLRADPIGTQKCPIPKTRGSCEM